MTAFELARGSIDTDGVRGQTEYFDEETTSAKRPGYLSNELSYSIRHRIPSTPMPAQLPKVRVAGQCLSFTSNSLIDRALL